jgi:hypothetical protein
VQFFDFGVVQALDGCVKGSFIAIFDFSRPAKVPCKVPVR